MKHRDERGNGTHKGTGAKKQRNKGTTVQTNKETNGETMGQQSKCAKGHRDETKTLIDIGTKGHMDTQRNT